VIAPGESAEHANGVLIVGGFSEDLVFQTNDGIGTEDNIIQPTYDCNSFLPGNAPNELGRCLTGVASFWDGSGTDHVVDAGGEEDLMPARGSGSQNEHQANNIAKLRNEPGWGFAERTQRGILRNEAKAGKAAEPESILRNEPNSGILQDESMWVRFLILDWIMDSGMRQWERAFQPFL
jgi:hypothetical protein